MFLSLKKSAWIIARAGDGGRGVFKQWLPNVPRSGGKVKDGKADLRKKKKGKHAHSDDRERLVLSGALILKTVYICFF